MTASAHGGVDIVAAGTGLERGYCLGEENGSVVESGGHMAAMLRAPVGAVLEGGYNVRALCDCAMATISALAGAGTAASIAPDPFVTSRIAAHVGHFWTL